MNCTTRLILQPDEPFLWDMLYHALYVPEGEAPLPRNIIQQPEIRQYVQNWGQPDDFGLIALVDDKAVGAVWVRRIKAYGFIDDETPELSIAMLPEHRGKGVGTILMNELFLLVKTQYSAISLSVSLDNPALRLYERLGFEIIKSDGHSVTMKRMLI